MYDPDGDYSRQADARPTDESAESYRFYTELPTFCMQCGVMLTPFTWQPWKRAVFCADCVADRRSACQHMLDLLGRRDWDGTVVAFSGLQWLAPKWEHMWYVGLWECGLYMELNKKGLGLEASACLKNVHRIPERR